MENWSHLLSVTEHKRICIQNGIVSKKYWENICWDDRCRPTQVSDPCSQIFWHKSLPLFHKPEDNDSTVVCYMCLEHVLVLSIEPKDVIHAKNRWWLTRRQSNFKSITRLRAVPENVVAKIFSYFKKRSNLEAFTRVVVQWNLFFLCLRKSYVSDCLLGQPAAFWTFERPRDVCKKSHQWLKRDHEPSERKTKKYPLLIKFVQTYVISDVHVDYIKYMKIVNIWQSIIIYWYKYVGHCRVGIIFSQ